MSHASTPLPTYTDAHAILSSTASSGTAREVLRATAALVTEHLQPAARAQATAATLVQIADIPAVADLPLSALQLRDGLLAAAEARADDTPPTTNRRRTCADIANALPRWLSAREAAPQAAAVWRTVAEHFPGSDGRAEAIRATWAREAAEIAAWAPRRRREEPQARTYTAGPLTLQVRDGATAKAHQAVDLLVHEGALDPADLCALAHSLLGYAAARDERLQPALEAADAALATEAT